MLCVNFVTRITYQVYCNRKIRFIRFRYIIEKDIIKDMSVYAFWSLCGSAANVFAIQGQNILLNMFFGPVVNAAREWRCKFKMQYRTFLLIFKMQ